MNRKKKSVGQNMTRTKQNRLTGLKATIDIKSVGSAQGREPCKKNCQNTNNKTNVFKIECCGSSGQLPTERMEQKVCRFQSKIRSFESLRSWSQCSVHRKIGAKMSLTRAKERATSACRCRSVSVSVQRYSVQYKGYNLIGVTTVEGGTARGTTTLVYLQLHISLYTGTVHV